MTVQRIWAAGKHYTVTGSGYAPEGEFKADDQRVDPNQDPALRLCLEAGLLCNDSRIEQSDEGWRIQGDPTEAALLTAAYKAGLDDEKLRRQQPRLDVLPFESERQYMATLHAIDDQKWILIKGSADQLLPRCTQTIDQDGNTTDFDPESVEPVLEDMTGDSLRVLCFARKQMESDDDSVQHRDLESGLTLLGLQAMIDPPRPEAIAAVETCHRAGIRVKMITGDHAGTAAAIARGVGITDGDDARVLTGRQLEDMDDAAFAKAALETDVFARVAPEQKLRLVKALQAHGQVTAMTGDGVNDAPALRRSDIGVAMGQSGTDVAQDAADMVLTDDNFASIEAAVEEGRGVFDNLVKFIGWTLPTNIGMGLVILAAIVSGAALPIEPVQILWINMTTVVLLGLTLAFEEKEPDLMQRPPRDPNAPILGPVLMFRIVLVGILLLAGSFGLFQWALAQGMTEHQARTIAANVFVVGELFYLFNCRSLEHSMLSLGLFSNPLLWAGCVLMILLQLLFTYAPFMHALFRTASVSAESWLWTTLAGVAIYLIIGLEKLIRRGLHSTYRQ
jgi:calcium-translocating P-type ATPase